jgi:hypothetical protein
VSFMSNPLFRNSRESRRVRVKNNEKKNDCR